MREALTSMGLVLLLSATVWSQTTPAAPVERVCPLDGHRFAVPKMVRGDQRGGADSDQCVHDYHGHTLVMEVVVCPRCSYAALKTLFAMPLPPEKKAPLLRELAKSRYRGVTNSWTEIPSWERSRLADRCAVVTEREDVRLDCLKMASWNARVEACRPATVAVAASERVIMPLAMGGAVGIEDVIRELRNKIKEETKPVEKNRLRLHLAMMSQRAGFVKDRDATLAELKIAAAADAAMLLRVKRFEELVAIETGFQKQFVEVARAYLAGKDKPPLDRIRLSYALADTLRRLGRNDEAVKTYRDTRKLMTTAKDLRVLTDHFLTMLAPGEPLPVPGKEEPAETPATDATGKEPPAADAVR